MARRFELCAALALALALWAGAAAAEWSTETRASGLKVATGTAIAHWGGQSVPAALHVECYPGEDGSLTLLLEVDDVETFAGFPYLDFEGPDAPLNERSLFRVAAGDFTQDLYQGGWFMTGTDFAFAHSDIPAGEGPVRSVVNAILAGASPLVISVLHPDGPTKAIVADIPLDGALPALTTATEGCRD